MSSAVVTITSSSEETDSDDIVASSSSELPVSSSGNISPSGSEEMISSSSLSEGLSSEADSFRNSSSVWGAGFEKESFFNPDVTYGTLVDERDGKIYKTVVIGSQTWMAENLNYADSVQTPSLKESSWCRNDDADECSIFGRLYTWIAAIDSISLANDANDPQNCGYGVVCDRLKDDALALAPVQGVCPNGWHLLSLAEWETLFESVDGWKNSGTFLKSNFGWVDDGNGNNQYGFSAVAAGSRNAQGRFLLAAVNLIFGPLPKMKVKIIMADTHITCS